MIKERIMTLLILFATVFINLGEASHISEGQQEEMNREFVTRLRIDEIQSSRFAPELLWEYIGLAGIQHRDIVYRQAILETGWFTSGSFAEFNNLFGMKVPRIRVDRVAGSGYGHASYSHWTQSVDDYKLWQDYWRVHPNVDYYGFLDEVGYAEAKNYTKILRQIEVLIL